MALYYLRLKRDIRPSGALHGQHAMKTLQSNLLHMNSLIDRVLEEGNRIPGLHQILKSDIFIPTSSFNKELAVAENQIPEELRIKMDKWDSIIRAKEQNSMILKELNQFTDYVLAKGFHNYLK
jgi:hypothetical protein